MINKTLLKFKKHTLFILYLLMIIGICFGVYNSSGLVHIQKIISYLVALVLIYILVNKYIIDKNRNVDITFMNNSNNDVLLNIVIGVSLLTCIFHLLYLGYIPVWETYKSLYGIEISFIREDVLSKLNTTLNYLVAFNLNATIPFIFYQTFKRKKRYFVILYIILFFYLLNVLQKSYLLFAILPLAILMFNQKYYKLGIATIVLSTLSIFFIIWLSNPQLRASSTEIDLYAKKYISKNIHANTVLAPQAILPKSSVSSQNVVLSIFIGFYNRIALVPGHVVSKWFDYIPQKLPYTHGYNIRPIALISGKNYQDYNYSRMIYDLEFPEDAKNGLKGTANVAHFMNDYASFGFWGLFFSALQVVIIIQLLQHIFKNNISDLISFNLNFMLALSSTALTTTLFSGGWALMIVYYFLFNQKK